MRKLTIVDALKLEHNEAVPSISGTIEKVWDYKTGEGEYGPWSFQNFTMKDGTGKIKCVLSNREEVTPSRAEGRNVFMQCIESKKHGLTGLKIEDKAFKSKDGSSVKEKALKITGSAEVIFVQDDPNIVEDRTKKIADDSCSIHPEPTAVQRYSGLSDAKKSINQHANLYLQCYMTVETMIVPEVKRLTGRDLDSAQKQAASSSLFITADRKGMAVFFPDYSPTSMQAKSMGEKHLEEGGEDSDSLPY